MKKFNLKTILQIKTPKKNAKQNSVELWLYGYYACSSLCMVPAIDFSK